VRQESISDLSCPLPDDCGFITQSLNTWLQCSAGPYHGQARAWLGTFPAGLLPVELRDGQRVRRPEVSLKWWTAPDGTVAPVL